MAFLSSTFAQIFLPFRLQIIVFIAVCCANTPVYSQGSGLKDAISNTKTTIDSTAKLQLRKVIVVGNRKTKSYIILREMQVKVGDSVIVSNIPAILEVSRNFIYNTTLFVQVSLSPIIIDSANFDINVDVVERWYIFPIPVFQLADRSYNEWIEKYNASLARVSYGLRFYHKNASGRNDQFSITLINGFTRNVSFTYKAPYSNPSLTEGVSAEGGLSQTREIPFKTSDKNNIIYFKNDRFVKNEWFIGGAYISRKGLKKRETFTLGFRHIKVDDSILAVSNNPNFFNSDKASQNFPELEYKLQFIDVDNIIYPLKGYAATFIINKRGLGITGNINRLTLRAVYNLYFTYQRKWYSSIRISGEVKLPFDQPYYNSRALGYRDDYLRGDEYFVIDGVVSALAKFDLKKEALRFNVPTFLKSKTYGRIPFIVYAKTFFDIGYSYIQPEFDTRLNNRFLYSGGLGIDVLTLYDLKISIEYSLNQLGQKGLFLHN
ncbi:MAG: POTRA domain-containing protein [Ginsengibacter sp.]